MQTATIDSSEASQGVKAAPDFTPLVLEKRYALDTATTAVHVGRRPQTLRVWAMKDGTGPIRPIRVHGRLAWKVADIKALLGVA